MAKYRTGEIVQPGDHIRTPRGDAVIVRVLQPGTQDAIDFSCPKGGLLWQQSHAQRGGGRGLEAIESLDPKDWEIEFVSRGVPPKLW